MPITDNALIEELLGAAASVICIEDIIDALINCHKLDSHFEEVRTVLWPI